MAKHLSVEVSASPLVGVEGWCVRGVNTIVRLNSSSSKSRQRFTLSHELAHLVLGTEPDIATEPFRSDRREERDADQLASEFLIPSAQLEVCLRGRLPVDAKTLTRLAKAAKVSPVMAACRVVSATEELGLQNSAVVFFVNGREQWRYSHGLRFDEDDARSLLSEALNHKPDLVRAANHDRNVVVGSIIDAPAYQVLFIQLLPADDAARQTYEERMRSLASKLFGADHSFRQSVAASLGIVKKKCAGQSLGQAFGYFMQHYPGVKYPGDKGSRLESKLGREYIRLYLQRWFQ
ncbi:MAG: ImmA/IrrE family metallo-endopeptidase [Pirellulaceae bacterium]|nr:ImmA/IrrE family metallo-endopeptidase [Pirellulaceae bacterium]